MTTMRQVVLTSHPEKLPHIDCFAVQEVPVPSIADGEVLLKTLWLSLDPMVQFAIQANANIGPNRVGIGETIYGGTVSKVVASQHPDFKPGDYVEGRTGWAEFTAVNPTSKPLRQIDPELAPLSTALGAIGMPGQTAHACMIGVGRVQAGETVVISAAAGAVGSLAGQIGKILGARVVGIAGGSDKCASVEALGFDACVDYKADDFASQLAAACPKGIDVYIENVGGAVTRTVLPLMNYRSRMPVCGFIAYYGLGQEPPGPDYLPWFMRMVMSKGLEVKGFGGALVAGPQALEDLAQWYREGLLKHPEAVVEGLENAPAAFTGIFAGNSNVGKLLVKVADSGD